MLTEKYYCDFKTCIALKKLGYNEKTLAYYTSDGFFHWIRAYIYDVAIPDLANSSNKKPYKHIIDAMSLYEAQKWLREKKRVNIVVCPYAYVVETDTYTWTYEIWFGDNFESEVNAIDSYEEALSEGIKEAVKILKDM